MIVQKEDSVLRQCVIVFRDLDASAARRQRQVGTCGAETGAGTRFRPPPRLLKKSPNMLGVRARLSLPLDSFWSPNSEANSLEGGDVDSAGRVFGDDSGTAATVVCPWISRKAAISPSSREEGPTWFQA